MVPVPVKRTIRRSVQWSRLPQARLRLPFGVTPLRAPWPHHRGRLSMHRYDTEQFLREQAADIHGHCLEFLDGNYARTFGGERVTKLDILHKDEGNPHATLVADLTQPNPTPSNEFDCIICTYTLHLVLDVHAFVQELQRILTPGGVLVLVVPHIAPYWPGMNDLWRFSPEGLATVLASAFHPDKISIRTYGNSLTAIGDLRGLVAEEFTTRELHDADDRFAVAICARALKAS